MDRLEIIQSVRIGANITDIMKLDCVRQCRKVVTRSGVFFSFKLFPLSMASPNPTREAMTGDWLCQLKDGKWVIMSDYEYGLRNAV